jgi:hypothetical protein
LGRTVEGEDEEAWHRYCEKAGVEEAGLSELQEAGSEHLRSLVGVLGWSVQSGKQGQL